MMTDTNMSTQYQDVSRQIQEIIESFFGGIRVSWLERRYQQKFKSALNYESLGVTNMEELLDKMCADGMVFFSPPESRREKYVITVGMVESRQKFVKRDVQDLLVAHSGEIKFSSFEKSFKDKFKVKLSYHHYGVTDLDHFCNVLKDILVVKENSSTEKVIQAVKIHNLRKRKRNE